MQKTLKEWRAVRGMSQHSLSAESGVQQATISNLENGINRNVKPETIRRLIRVLEIPFEDLDLEQIHIIQPKDGANGSVAIPEGFPEQLEAARQTAGLTLEKVAERLGLSDKTVKHVVSGKTRRVKPDTLKALQGFVEEYVESVESPESCLPYSNDRDMEANSTPLSPEPAVQSSSPQGASQATGLSTDKRAQAKESHNEKKIQIRSNFSFACNAHTMCEVLPEILKILEEKEGVTYELH